MLSEAMAALEMGLARWFKDEGLSDPFARGKVNDTTTFTPAHANSVRATDVES